MSEETIERLYEALARRDGEAMAVCYAPDATFEDPVFSLRGDEVGDMWRMLTERGGDLEVSHEILGPDRARWTARYTFEGRPVTNEITSAFTFDAEGRISAQLDAFDFPRWAAQALGWKGRLLGRTGWLRGAVRKTSAARLARWRARRG